MQLVPSSQFTEHCGNVKHSSHDCSQIQHHVTESRVSRAVQPVPSDARQLHVMSPIMNAAEVAAISEKGFKVATLPTLYDIASGPAGLEKVSLPRGLSRFVLSDMGTLLS